MIGVVEGRVRRLQGYQRNHRLPSGHHAAAQAFVRRVGHPEVQQLAERLYADIRSLFAYKRREFAYCCEDGFAAIKTPDFDLHISIQQCPTEPHNYQLSTELSAVHQPAIAAEAPFINCFTPHCDTVVVDFPQPIDLNDKIDAIEEIPDMAAALDYQPDGGAFELKLTALDLHIRVTPMRMSFQLLRQRNLGILIAHSQKAFDILTAAGLQT